MPNLHKSNELKLISLAKIRSFSAKDSKELISAIGKAVGKFPPYGQYPADVTSR